MTSLTATGTPARGGRGLPFAIRASTRSAWRRARSGVSAGHGQIFAQSCIRALVIGQDLSHGLDLGGIQLVELADVLENFVNLRAVSLELGLAQIQVGQLCHAQHVFPADFHGDFLIGSRQLKILTQPRKEAGRRSSPSRTWPGQPWSCALLRTILG